MKFLHIRENDPRWNRLRQLLASSKGRKVAGGICIVAVLLLVLSEWMPKETKKETALVDSLSQAYQRQLEEELAKTIEAIDGAGKTQVLITLRCGPETIYARNSKTRTDDVSNGENEQSYVLLRSGNAETGLALKTVIPAVQGVAVVCEGADNPQVRQSITDTVTAALDVRGSHVSVVKMKSERN